MFLAKVGVRISYYDDFENVEKLHIVVADTEYAAAEKVRSYYESKTVEYDTYYYVESIELTEAIQ